QNNQFERLTSCICSLRYRICTNNLVCTPRGCGLGNLWFRGGASAAVRSQAAPGNECACRTDDPQYRTEKELTMAMQCVVAVYDSGTRASLAVNKLTEAGFPRENISFVARSLKGEETEVKRALELGDSTERDATLGAGIGGLIGAVGGTSAI